MFGTVTRYFKDKGYGFIRGDNGKSYFIHNSKLNGEYIECDYYVFFRPFHNNKGNCAAQAYEDLIQKIDEYRMERKSSKFDNPMYNKGYEDGFADGANSIEE